MKLVNPLNLRTLDLTVLVTGANGFVGKNLTVALRERGIKFECYERADDLAALREKIKNCDHIFHLAGANRPTRREEFQSVNVNLTNFISDELKKYKGKKLFFASSVQAVNKSDYGISKAQAEDLLQRAKLDYGLECLSVRLPNIFGKWCRPFYNSVVATYCYNIWRDLPCVIDNPNHIITLAYIDDIIKWLIELLDQSDWTNHQVYNGPTFQVSLSELSEKLNSFKDHRETRFAFDVTRQFDKLLYATFLSYMPPEKFAYDLQKHEDERGMFSEFVKIFNGGQVSIITIKNGQARGGHYHHTKVEKFLVVKGGVEFNFKNILTKETYAVNIEDRENRVIETAPGWQHSLRNVKEEEAIVVIWCNENFDPKSPDTFVS